MERLPLIALFHVQIQQPKSRSTTTRAFVFPSKFYYHKIFETQEVDDDLSVCVDECSPCGLSVTGDIDIYQCHVIER